MKIFIFGAGHMGGAIARALTKRHLVYVYDRHPGRGKIKGTNFDSGLKHLVSVQLVIVAVKPQDVPALAKEIQTRLNPSSLLVSIAAGISLNKLGRLFAHKKIVRIMPSLALTVGQGVAFWKAARAVSPKEKILVGELFGSFMEHHQVKNEKLIDAGSVIYGSGPAFFFLMAQALQRAAEGLGVSQALSRRLVEKTFFGAALLQKNQDYRDLIAKIASKRGVTEAALKVFSKWHFQQLVRQAAGAGLKRTKKLNHG